MKRPKWPTIGARPTVHWPLLQEIRKCFIVVASVCISSAISKHTLACNRQKIVFFTAVEHWPKGPLSSFAAQCRDFTCLWMSLSSFSEAFSKSPDIWLDQKIVHVLYSLKQVVYISWGKKILQLYCCIKSNFIFSTIIITNIQKTLKSSNARVKHTYIISRWQMVNSHVSHSATHSC